MKITETQFPGLIIIEPKIFGDSRGYFYEIYNKQRYAEEGINVEFVQDNVSLSKKNTLRGLHFQTGEWAQAKLCWVDEGEVLDITVDLRKDSPTYLKHNKILLSGEDKKQIYLPKGFAHGFVVKSEFAVFKYKCDQFYHPESEKTIIYNDENLNIDWEADNPIISEKDKRGLTLNDILKII